MSLTVFPYLQQSQHILSVIIYMYIPRNLGFCFHPNCAVYDASKYPNTLRPESHICLVARHTISLSPFIRLIWRHCTYEILVMYVYSALCMFTSKSIVSSSSNGKYEVLADSPQKGQWRGPLVFVCLFFICAWTNGWANNGNAGDWRRHSAHYDFIVMMGKFCCHTIRNCHVNFIYVMVSIQAIWLFFNCLFTLTTKKTYIIFLVMRRSGVKSEIRVPHLQKG